MLLIRFSLLQCDHSNHVEGERVREPGSNEGRKSTEGGRREGGRWDTQGGRCLEK